jgi:protein required for attachment to host cells
LAAHEFGALRIFASNPFLGELKAALSDAVAQRVTAAHDTDLSALGLAEIEHRLRDPALMPP